MRCPNCSKPDSRVVDSRVIEDNLVIRRRRECDNCHYRFTTFERIEGTNLMVIKRDGSREPYSREKLINGLWRACIKRPISQPQVEKMVQECEQNWFGNKEIASEKIGDDVMKRIRELDEIAYIRFASVYKDFKSVDEFKNIVEEK